MADRESIIVRFVEITGSTRSEAIEFLDATNWAPIEEAVHIFFNDGHVDHVDLREISPEKRTWPYVEYDNRSGRKDDASYYTSSSDSNLSDNEAPFHNSPLESGPPGVGDGDEPFTPEGQGLDSERSGAPQHLKFFGNFQAAKELAQRRGKWILASIHSSNPESRLLNWKVWNNAEIQDIVREHFIFWQIYDYSEEGKKVIDWYKINQKPAVLIIDPHTGYKMHDIEGSVSVDDQRIIELLSLYTEKGPLDSEDRKNLAAPLSSDYVESQKSPTGIEYPTLPREPVTGTPGVVNIVIRFPYGSRIQRKFLATDPIQVLWSFAASQIPKDNKVFVLECATRGVKLNYYDRKTIEEAGVADSVLTLVFEG